MNHDSKQFDRNRLIALADEAISRTASAEEIRQLEAMLRNDAEARREYLRYALLCGQLSLTTIEPPPITHRRPSVVVLRNRNQRLWSGVTIAIAAAAAILVAVLIGPSATDQTQRHHASVRRELNNSVFEISHYDNRDLPVETVAMLRSGPSLSRSISPTTLRIAHGTTRFDSASGADVHVEGPAVFGVSSQASGVLYSGSVLTRLRDPNSTFSVLASNLRIVDLGTEFRVAMIDDHHVKIQVLDGKVDVQARIRLPLYFWNFDPRSETLGKKFSIGQSAFTLGPSARRVQGIIGDGAMGFDNTKHSYVQIDRDATGPLAAGPTTSSSGVSIEAMFVSRWRAKYLDYDEIFRKEDGVYRMLLSFQNDSNAAWDYAFPPVADGPCLSFGLHLDGLDYSELDMPLDGKEGRPTVADLTDGQPHHVVATYDSFSGNKSIYIDGELRFQHAFPRGTLILNGGPAVTEIGNFRQCEPFNGVIDEVAYYDFALTAVDIAAHYKNVKAGKMYFNGIPGILNANRWRSVTHVREGDHRIFNINTGLPVESRAAKRL